MLDRTKNDLSLTWDYQKFLRKDDKEKELWTTNYLVYRIKEHLGTVAISASHKTDLLDDWYPAGHDNKVIDFRKYYNQAYHYLKIGRLQENKVPKFLISIAELSPRIIKELQYYSRDDRNYILKQSVALIFQEINSEIYHNSISNILEVSLVR